MGLRKLALRGSRVLLLSCSVTVVATGAVEGAGSDAKRQTAPPRHDDEISVLTVVPRRDLFIFSEESTLCR